MPRLSLKLYSFLFLSLAMLLPKFSYAQNPPTEQSVPPPAAAQANDSAMVQDVQVFLEPFVYDPRGRRDPFKPYGGMVDDTLPKKSAEGFPVQTVVEGKPLQSYDLDQFRLVAVMWDINTPKAMFLDPSQQVHVVGRDERIGRKNGYIATIREGEVVVVEQTKNDADQVSYATKVLRIQR